MYSLSRAVRFLLKGENCFEKEISDSLAKELGHSFAGIGIPHTSFMRDLTAGGAGLRSRTGWN
jgi:hypothetical protein